MHGTSGAWAHLVEGVRAAMRQEGARARVAQDVILWHPAHHLQQHDSLYWALTFMA